MPIFKLFLVSVFTLSLVAPLSATEVSLGLGAAWQSSPYREHDDSLLPFPIVNIEGERFYLHGPDLGAYLFKNEKQAISLGVSYGSPSFDSDDTDDTRLKRLDDREASANAYLHYAVTSDYGQAGLKIFHDILGRSQAFSAEAAYKYPFSVGPVYLSPGAGLVWESEEYVNYYYGVSAKEARKSGLAEYSPDAGLSPFLSMEANWQFSDQWGLMAAEKVLFLNDEIKSSPMVDDSQVFSTFIGLRYTL